ncbi:MAG: hypothetical protein J0L81_05210 [Caulobacterales bacterium]|nr:hypothetical protein [Caulobacterales bacterium]
MQPDFDGFFRVYSDLYNRALRGDADYSAIAACFSSSFIAAGPQGVRCGQNDAAFRETLQNGYAFYRQIGTRSMSTVRCETVKIDAAHFMVKVFYCAEYQKESAAPVTIDFDVTYLLETTQGEPKIFAFIAGDEMDAYRRAGLID